MKAKREHIVPLSPQALDILEVMKPVSAHREHVFPSRNCKYPGKTNHSLCVELKRVCLHLHQYLRLCMTNYLKAEGKLFTPCRKAFERAVKRAGIALPDGQCTYVLRHTFASHFMINGGNILVLRGILGHSDIKMTMIYAHFSPDYQEDAVTKKPLYNLI